MKISKETLAEIRSGFALAGYDPALAHNFVKGILGIGKRLGYSNPDEFAAQTLNLIKLESGFNPKAKNTLGYQGFIQFSPNNAKVHGYDADPIKQLSSIESYLKSNKNTLYKSFGKNTVDRDMSENGSILLTSVLTGPNSRSLVDPSVSQTKDAYGTDNAKYYKNIRAGLNCLKGNDADCVPIQQTETNTQLAQQPSPPQQPPLQLDTSHDVQDQHDNLLALQEQNHPEELKQDLNMDLVSQVIEMMQKNNVETSNMQQQLQAQTQQADQDYQQQLLASQRQAKELEVQNKSKQLQAQMDQQRQELFKNMPLKDDDTQLATDFSYEGEKTKAPRFDIQPQQSLRFGQG